MSRLPESMAGWVAYLEHAEIPVLRQTARELDRLRASEDQLSVRNAAKIVANDPLMTVKLLRFLQTHKRNSQLQEVVQIEQAILMMGFDAFYRNIPAQPIVENMLQDHMDALVQLLQTVKRAQRAAYWAYQWALRLHDLHAEEVFVSTLLYHVTEMLMWCFNTEAMIKIRRLQSADRMLRSRELQHQMLGFVGVDLQREVAAHWQLPQLLQNLFNPSLVNTSRVRNVTLAVNLARHAAHGWNDAALPDDYAAIGDLLRISRDSVMEMIGAKENVEPVELASAHSNNSR